MASMIVSWHTGHNLVTVLSTEVFMAWVVFVKVIFLCVNIKCDDGVLPYNMPEVFEKNKHGLADKAITWGEFKPVLHPQYLWE